jgi:hypothetical protein
MYRNLLKRVKIHSRNREDRMKEPGLDNRHRDKNGEISRKHGNTLISTLRRTYGANFAPAESPDAKLGDVLHRLDEPSLRHLVNDLAKK